MALKKFSELAAAIRSEQDASLCREPVAPLDQRAENLRVVRGKRRKARSIRHAVGVTTVLAAAAAAAFLLAPRPTDFEVGTSRAPGATGVWLTSPPSQEIPLFFHDGSQMVLSDAHFQVEHVEPEGAKVIVEKGSVRASVVHRPQSKWLVVVGPFQIVVRGTQFDASWDPDQRKFRLRMKRGAVLVRGGASQSHVPLPMKSDSK